MYKLLVSGDTKSINAEFNRDIEQKDFYSLPHFMQLIKKVTVKQGRLPDQQYSPPGRIIFPRSAYSLQKMQI